jgi:hypothetical protein
LADPRNKLVAGSANICSAFVATTCLSRATTIRNREDMAIQAGVPTGHNDLKEYSQYKLREILTY